MSIRNQTDFGTGISYHRSRHQELAAGPINIILPNSYGNHINYHRKVFS